mmetsp:Transcript_5657/g.12413  ORF Transcript_5657/g.12413 Transcript_5657/m.12413 type:complete len:204 (-) Transcript_5657:41-652(-)
MLSGSDTAHWIWCAWLQVNPHAYSRFRERFCSHYSLFHVPFTPTSLPFPPTTPMFNAFQEAFPPSRTISCARLVGCHRIQATTWCSGCWCGQKRASCTQGADVCCARLISLLSVPCLYLTRPRPHPRSSRRKLGPEELIAHASNGESMGTRPVNAAVDAPEILQTDSPIGADSSIGPVDSTVPNASIAEVKAQRQHAIDSQVA